ncbi:TPA: AI-2E family transporter, partial [Campylobacter jejuni]|nr:AI-2E family transporter [Campylobacter jejuni]
LIYVPVSLYEFASNNLNSALVIFIYSVIVISFIADTLIKPLIIKWINKKLVKTPTKINELLIFLAMIAGISTFGFWGIILGPAILTFFVSTLRMYVILKDKNLI